MKTLPGIPKPKLLTSAPKAEAAVWQAERDLEIAKAHYPNHAAVSTFERAYSRPARSRLCRHLGHGMTGAIAVRPLRLIAASRQPQK